MNKERRVELEKLCNQLEEVMGAVESLRDEEQEYQDNMPENLQGSVRYDIAEEAIQSMDAAMSGIQDAMDGLESALGG